jgi:hypothetical protein
MAHTECSRILHLNQQYCAVCIGIKVKPHGPTLERNGPTIISRFRVLLNTDPCKRVTIRTANLALS